jgi:hypothetical protein
MMSSHDSKRDRSENTKLHKRVNEYCELHGLKPMTPFIRGRHRIRWNEVEIQALLKGINIFMHQHVSLS